MLVVPDGENKRPKLAKDIKQFYIGNGPNIFSPKHVGRANLLPATPLKAESEFNLIDGFVAANNPTMAAIMRIAREVILDKNSDFPTSVNYKNFIVISIGTGSVKMGKENHHCKNFLRIQPKELSKTMFEMDNATKDNMGDLIKIGEEVLKDRISVMDVHSAMYKQLAELGTHEEELTRLAKILSDERRLRLERTNNNI
ncbi:hypothetical protein E2562_016074 [Oryza meyeriana var. granulata]|uniref:PNPLA domain-containing protein n=1 Tax=Oryza meyeriana var. granulata TaxID=110450 RepID=A0A6G1BLL2_9ORYZ|nr:hypothetical protein E2562_016074 [Oryza meyeriana var. granulata]